MGNLISIHMEIFLKPRMYYQSMKPTKIISKLLERLNGISYNGHPVIIKIFHYNNLISYRISYGEKYEPQALFEFCNENISKFDRIFARTSYESGDLDYILSFPNQINNYEEIRRECRYQFDEVFYKLKEKEEIYSPLTINSKIRYSKVKLSGEMYGLSDLTVMEETNEIWDPLENKLNLKTYALNKFSSNNKILLEKIILKSVDIVFKYKGITVHRKISPEERIRLGHSKSPNDIFAYRHNKGFYDIYYSSWANCSDIEYLEYINKNNISDT